MTKLTAPLVRIERAMPAANILRTSLLLIGSFATGALAQDATVTPLVTKPLAGMAGKEGVMVTVEYPPGAASAAHRHNANTFVYVLEGSVVMQVRGGPELTLNAGDTFYESPADIHSVSQNASASMPARLLVLFVKDVGAPPTVPAD
jgi:quercetin dioxygenase-like cupin family protein